MSEDPTRQIRYDVISTATTDGSGRLYAALPMESVVMVVGAAGKVERTVGRRGAGPGEFTRISGMGFRSERFWVGDAALRRFTEFSADGKVLGTRTFQDILGERGITDNAVARWLPVALLENDAVLLRAQRADLSPMRTANSDGALVLANPGARRFDTLTVLTERSPHLEVEIEGSGPLRMLNPFARNDRVAVDPHGRMIAAARYESRANEPGVSVTAWSPDGKAAFDRFVPIPDRSVTAAEKREVARSIASSIAQSSNRRETVNSIELALARALNDVQSAPGIASLMVGADLSVWLRLFGRGGAWLVISPDGKQLLEFTLSGRNESLIAADANHVWTSEEADSTTGVRRIVRYSLTR